MDKSGLLKAIIAHFQHEYDVVITAARNIYEAATHPDAKAENKYDTRGLEASYLAESQSKRALDIKQTISTYRKMEPKPFEEDDAVAMGCPVVAETEAGQASHYFIGPRGGGTEVVFEGVDVMIISAASPLGRALLGKELGDSVSIGVGAKARELEITALS